MFSVPFTGPGETCLPGRAPRRGSTWLRPLLCQEKELRRLSAICPATGPDSPSPAGLWVTLPAQEASLSPSCSVLLQIQMCWVGFQTLHYGTLSSFLTIFLPYRSPACSLSIPPLGLCTVHSSLSKSSCLQVLLQCVLPLSWEDFLTDLVHVALASTPTGLDTCLFQFSTCS